MVLENGEAEILTQLSSSSKTHKIALESLSEKAHKEGPKGGGQFSIQNGLQVAGRSLGHQPRHGSREILIVCGALSTCDQCWIRRCVCLLKKRKPVALHVFDWLVSQPCQQIQTKRKEKEYCDSGALTAETFSVWIAVRRDY